MVNSEEMNGLKKKVYMFQLTYMLLTYMGKNNFMFDMIESPFNCEVMPSCTDLSKLKSTIIG